MYLHHILLLDFVYFLEINYFIVRADIDRLERIEAEFSKHDMKLYSFRVNDKGDIVEVNVVKEEEQAEEQQEKMESKNEDS